MNDISEIAEEDLKQCLKRLTLYARKKFFKLGWIRKHCCRIGPKSMGPQDVASEAIIRVIEGKRKYNKQAYPDFMIFLESVVDSIISNMLSLVEHKKVQTLPNKANACDQTKAYELESNELPPVHILINKDMIEKIECILMKTFANDNIVCGILECLRAGITKPSEIAEYLEVKTKDINNAKKRLQRAIDSELQKYKLEYLK